MFLYSVHLLKTLLILRSSDRDIVINVHRSLCKVPVILVRFYDTWHFPTEFRKYSNFMKILPVEVELVHADRQTGKSKLTIKGMCGLLQGL